MGFAKLTDFLGESVSYFYFVVSLLFSSALLPGFCKVVAPPLGLEHIFPIFIVKDI